MVNPLNSGSTRWCVETTTVPGVPGEERTDNCRLPPYRRVTDFQNLFPASFQALASPATRRPHNRPLYWGRRYERRRNLGRDSQPKQPSGRGRCSRRPSPVPAVAPGRLSSRAAPVWGHLMSGGVRGPMGSRHLRTKADIRGHSADEDLASSTRLSEAPYDPWEAARSSCT